MYERILGKDLRVSAVGLGCMGFSHAYGAPTEKNEAIKTLRDSLDLGYTFFDTAECYGPYENEELVGEAFAHCRDEVVIATKFGVTHAPDRSLLLNSRPETIRKPIPGSRKIYRLSENAKSAEIFLSKSEVSELTKALDKVGMSEVFGGHKAK